MSKRAIGVLGGIFDPVHNGHISMACLAREHFGLDAVYMIPAGVPPHKSTSVNASPEHRLAMLRLALAETPDLVVGEHEIRRNGPSYTIDTLTALREQEGESEIHFLIGSDNLTEIPAWRRYQDILSSVKICVAERPGYALEPPEELGQADIRTFPSPRWAISSTVIRRYLTDGYSCRGMIPSVVSEYILCHKLYTRRAAGETQ